MKKFKINISLKDLISKLLSVFVLAFVVTLFIAVYFLGLVRGYVAGKYDVNLEYLSFLQENVSEPTPTRQEPSPTLEPEPTAAIYNQQVTWGGLQLWDVVNSKRQEYGVNALNQRDELCTIASIRLNELLDLGRLDGHEGFSNMREMRTDLEWIFERYSTIAEFLAVGGQSPEETVSLWDNTLGHKKLLTGGEYVWGCIYAQDTFAVAITAF